MFLTLFGMMDVMLMRMICNAEANGGNDAIATIEKIYDYYNKNYDIRNVRVFMISYHDKDDKDNDFFYISIWIL